MTEPNQLINRTEPMHHSRDLPRDSREVIRDEHLMRRPILRALESGPLTVPQLAEAIGAPEREVVFWVMGLRKYGWLAEIKGADDDGYFRYETAPRQS